MAGASQTQAGWSWARTSLGAALIVAAIETLFLFTGERGVRQGILLDPDCYMHLVRAYRLMTGAWQHGGFDPRLNAPFGYAIHWTGLFDALLAAGAWPLVWTGVGIHQALLVWGSAISPLLLMLALAAFALGVRPWVNGATFLWLTILLFTQPQLSGSFLVGRADHHSLILGLMLAELAWLYAAMDGRLGGGLKALMAAFAAGILAGVALSTTVEALLTILLVSLAMGFAWSLFARNVLAQLAAYWAGCLAVALLWLLFTRSHGFFQPLYDRISIVHAAVLAVGLAAVALSGLLGRHMPRIAALGVAALLAGLAIWALYPDFFLGPWPNLDPAIKAWHREIGELQPLLPDSLPHLGAFLGAFAASLVALPLTVTRLRHGETGERLMMLTALLGFVLFGGLSLAQMRWSGEMQAVMLVPWTLTTKRIMQSRIALKLPSAHIPLRSLFLMAALLLQVTPEAFAATPGRGPKPLAACDWDRAARALGRMPDQRGLVMTEIWYGPDILWRSGFDVVGGPYEIPPAIADTARFEKGSTGQARAVLKARHVRYVLTCGARADAQALHLESMAFAVPGFRFYRVKPL